MLYFKNLASAVTSAATNVATSVTSTVTSAATSVASAATDAATKVVTAVATTEMGQTYLMKPAIHHYINKGKEMLAAFELELSASSVLQKSPDVIETLQDLLNKSNQFIADIERDEMIDPILAITRKLLSGSSLEDLKKKLTESEPAKKFLSFLLSVVNFDQYKSLFDQISKFNKFEEFNAEHQQILFESLSNDTLTAQIREDLTKLNIVELKDTARQHGLSTCEFLTLLPEDTETLMSIFDSLTTKHLPTLEQAQKKLADQMPKFVETTKEYLVIKYPHLAIEHAAPLAITPALDTAASNDAQEKPDQELDQAEKVKLSL